jgi:hypothetical protein
MERQELQRLTDESQVAGPYEAPRVEFVLTAEELEREVMVAIVASPD